VQHKTGVTFFIPALHSTRWAGRVHWLLYSGSSSAAFYVISKRILASVYSDYRGRQHIALETALLPSQSECRFILPYGILSPAC